MSWLRTVEVRRLGSSVGARLVLLIPQIEEVPGPQHALNKDDRSCQNEESSQTRRSVQQIEARDEEQNDDEVPKPSESFYRTNH